MKKWILSALVLIWPVWAYAVSRQSEADFQDLGPQNDVTVSTSQFTALVPTTTYRSGSIGVLISQYTRNVSAFILRITSDTLTPSTTAQGFTYKPTDPPWILSISGAMNLWAVVQGTTTQKCYVQDLK